MRSDATRVPLVLAALVGGLALVVGVVVGGMVGNPFDGRASASTAALSGRLISLGTQTGVPYMETAAFPLVDVSDCYQMRVMASAPQTTGIGFHNWFNTSPDGTKAIHAYAVSSIIGGAEAVVDGYATTSGTIETPQRYVGLQVHQYDPSPTDITAWIWCVTSPSYAVGGIADLPPMAGIDGSPAHNYAIAAVLAFVAVVAFAAGGWYARRRWLA